MPGSHIPALRIPFYTSVPEAQDGKSPPETKAHSAGTPVKTPPAGSRRPRPGSSTVIPSLLEEATLRSHQSPAGLGSCQVEGPRHGKATWCDPGTRPVLPSHLLHQPAGWGRGFHPGVHGAWSWSEGRSQSTRSPGPGPWLGQKGGKVAS